MSEQDSMTDDDFDAELAAVERFINDVQQGSVPTGQAMRAYRDVHRPAIERLRTRLAEFEALLGANGVDDVTGVVQATGETEDGDAAGGSSSGSA